MATEPMVMVGTKVPPDWVEQVKAIATSTGRKPSEVIREFIGAGLGKHDPAAISSTLENHGLRISELEQRVSRLLKLLGG